MGFFQNLKYKKFKGFAAADFTKKESYTLYHGCLLSKDQLLSYQNLARDKKVAFVEEFFKSLPNCDNLKKAKGIFKLSLFNDGFNTLDNKFLQFMMKVDFDISHDCAELIKYFYDRKELNIDEEWLYNKSLYTEDEEEIIFKIKALVYASNKNLQAGADKLITPSELMQGKKISKANAMKKLLKTITIKK